MKKALGFGLLIVVLIVISISVMGATKLLNFGSQDGVRPPDPLVHPGLNPRPTDPATSIGYADLESRVLDLAPSQPGRVEEIPVKEDQEVRKDQLLLRLDDRAAKSVIDRAKADVKAAESKLEDAKKFPEKHNFDLLAQTKAIETAQYRVDAAGANAAEARKLQKTLQSSEEKSKAAEALAKAAASALEMEKAKLKQLELEDPESVIKQAEANLEEKKATLRQAENALDDCSLRAPIDGRILRILVGPGEIINANSKQPIIQFAPREPRIIRAEVEQEFAGRVRVGQPVRIEDDSHAETYWTGNVTRISDWYAPKRSKVLEPLQVNDVRTLECIVQLRPGQNVNELRIGRRVRVRFEDISAK